MYIAKDATFVESNNQPPKIIASQIGTIEVSAFLAVSPSEYSTTQVESGKILVISKNDNFIFQRLTQQDLKKNPKMKIKLMQREITCAKGKTVKKVLKTNIYDIKCPTGYKIK
jgi:Zn finger protein HypA/HybF involved in hydrogenase expression